MGCRLLVIILSDNLSYATCFLLICHINIAHRAAGEVTDDKKSLISVLYYCGWFFLIP